MADVAYIPDGNNQANNILPWMLAAGNGGLGGFGGNGWLPGMLLGSGLGYGGLGGFGGGGLLSGGIGFVLGLLFGNGWGGFGGNGFGNSSGAGFISNQIDNNAGRELLMNAINSNGEAARAAVQNLATMTGQDFNLLNSDIEAVKSALSSLALQQAVSVPQLINSIQSGNSELALQLCKCCCEQRQLTVEQGYQNQLATLSQTNTLANAISTASQRNVDAIADLKATTIDQFCALERRDMQNEINTKNEIITQLRNEADNARQTNAIASMLAPLAREIDEVKCKLPSTATVNYPNLVAVNATPYVSGGFYQGGFGSGNYFGPGFGGWGGFNNGFNF